MEIVLYSTHCPKCNVLKTKLDRAGIEYDICDNISIIAASGIRSVPVLQVDGKKLLFSDAVQWVNQQEVKNEYQHSYDKKLHDSTEQTVE